MSDAKDGERTALRRAESIERFARRRRQVSRSHGDTWQHKYFPGGRRYIEIYKCTRAWIYRFGLGGERFERVFNIRSINDELRVCVFIVYVINGHVEPLSYRSVAGVSEACSTRPGDQGCVYTRTRG